MANESPKSANGLRSALFIAGLCLIGTAYWVLAKGDDLPGKPKQADTPVPAEQILEFTTLYSQNCAACHGADGILGPAPPLNDALFRAIVPQTILQQVVSEGRPGTPMPGFARAQGGTLTAAQIQVLVHQIKGTAYKIIGGSANGTSTPTIVNDAAGISPAWGSPNPAPSDVPPYQSRKTAGRPGQPAARTSEDYEKIRTTIFARACSECHGDHGQGTEEAGAINKPEFLTLTSDQSLRRIIIAGRPDLGMPDYRGTDERASDFKPLKSAEIDDLVALLGEWRQGTAAGVK